MCVYFVLEEFLVCVCVCVFVLGKFHVRVCVFVLEKILVSVCICLRKNLGLHVLYLSLKKFVMCYVCVNVLEIFSDVIGS